MSNSRRMVFFVTCPTFQRQQRLILVALCTFHYLISLFSGKIDNTYRQKTHHDFSVSDCCQLWTGDVQRSLKGLQRALFCFGRHFRHCCSLCLAASLARASPFLPVCNFIIRDEKVLDIMSHLLGVLHFCLVVFLTLRTFLIT